ncbi:MAG: hypothetical protein KatS3mg011_2384 [Acidimicrobiia bacterium]|nr:MAG: hypothetical protein KatS3mg011_2384 [Acidimicrobiia bacterium]
MLAATGFELLVPDDLSTTELPTAEELAILREEVDPHLHATAGVRLDGCEAG